MERFGKTFGSWKLLETWMYRFTKNKNLDEMDVRLIILIVNTSKHVQRTVQHMICGT